MIFIGVNQYSALGQPHLILIKNEEDSNKELLGMGFFSNCGPFPCLCNNDDNEYDN